MYWEVNQQPTSDMSNTRRVSQHKENRNSTQFMVYKYVTTKHSTDVWNREEKEKPSFAKLQLTCVRAVFEYDLV